MHCIYLHWTDDKICRSNGNCVRNGQYKFCEKKHYAIRKIMICLLFFTAARCMSSAAICPGGCIRNAECVGPSLCRCLDGFTGPKCKWTPPSSPVVDRSKSTHHQHGMKPTSRGGGSVDSEENEVPVVTTDDDRDQGHGASVKRCRCLNGGRCVPRGAKRCKCPPGYTGPRCRSGRYMYEHYTNVPTNSLHLHFFRRESRSTQPGHPSVLFCKG